MRPVRIKPREMVDETATAPRWAEIVALSLGYARDTVDRSLISEHLRLLLDVLPLALANRLLLGGATALFVFGSRRLPVALAGLVLLLGSTVTLWLWGRASVQTHRQRLEMIARPLLGYAALSTAGFALLFLAGRNNASAMALLLALLLVETLALEPILLAAVAQLALVTLAFAALGAPAVTVLGLGAGLLFASAVTLARTRGHLYRARGRQRAELYTQRAVRLLAEFEDHGRTWFWETDADNRLTYVSPQLPRAVGRDHAAVIGRPITDLLITERGDSLKPDASSRTIGFHLSTRLAFREMEVRADCEGEVRWALTGRPVFDDFGRFLGFRGLGADLTEIRRSEAEVSKLARYDSLTGLSNRVMIRQTLNDAMREKGGRRSPCALFLLDLDRFKNVNDTLGHPVGDVLLKQVAERLTTVVGDMGQVGRLGGDEFQVVMPLMGDRKRLAELADRVIERLSIAYAVGNSSVSIGASLGIAIAPEDGEDGNSLIRNADLALYAAKAAGKGVHRFYEESMHADAHDRQLLELDLRSALANDQLLVYYQPIVAADSAETVGFEALVRWNHPVRGFVSPSVFVPIAEEIGLVQPIGEWVLRNACAQAAQWPEHIRIAVNISPLQFASPNLPSLVLNTLAQTGLPAHRLELEITEGVFLQNSDATEAMFGKLAAIGVRLALDDFGTGYSSLGYLQRAPFKKIKIDQSFVRGAAIPGSRNAAIIKAIVALADSLGMVTTAEGAETHDELALIRSLGCTQIQGYIFGRPMPGDDATTLVGQGGSIAPEGFAASRAPRIAVLRTGTIHVGSRSFPVRLRNISAYGAMAEIEGRAPSVGPIEIQLSDGLRIAGNVRWTTTGRFGVHFDRPFDLAQVQTGRPSHRRLRDILPIAS